MKIKQSFKFSIWRSNGDQSEEIEFCRGFIANDGKMLVKLNKELSEVCKNSQIINGYFFILTILFKPLGKFLKNDLTIY